ncbi:hypothetical protein K503DRAFT_859359 [Rhizopogon vinicolor AM-OR11-026]|uniref:Uncharacterized protein n=1 Tax=Rhizopogon vinicolor AM-OR11-026 TaxID=1314800 RepID=A0A1B7MNK9_9AGAM|nr:hypothetical protein K503DRAFT_859359 [Rhizopogon vinicolor AM-OR11-026]
MHITSSVLSSMSFSGMFSFSGAGTGLVSEGEFYSQPPLQNPRWGGESYSSSPPSLSILPLPDPFSNSASCSYQRSQFQQIKRIYPRQLTDPGLARALPSFRVTGGQTDYRAPQYSQDASELESDGPIPVTVLTKRRQVTTDKWDKTVSQGRIY